MLPLLPTLPAQVLGECGGAYVAGEQPATLAALRAELETPSSGRPLVVVLCQPAGTGAEEQAALLEGAQAALDGTAPTHLLVHAARPAAGEGEQRRRLLAEAGDAATLGVAAQSVGLLKADRANQTSNYTTCDPLCQKHVSGRGWGRAVRAEQAPRRAVCVCVQRLRGTTCKRQAQPCSRHTCAYS